jgi:hypothetical protein
MLELVVELQQVLRHGYVANPMWVVVGLGFVVCVNVILVWVFTQVIFLFNHV